MPTVWFESLVLDLTLTHYVLLELEHISTHVLARGAAIFHRKLDELVDIILMAGAIWQLLT
ncbi:hypothetical protein DSUL_160091 [Desulfovibrionales bacterium]